VSFNLLIRLIPIYPSTQQCVQPGSSLFEKFQKSTVDAVAEVRDWFCCYYLNMPFQYQYCICQYAILTLVCSHWFGCAGYTKTLEAGKDAENNAYAPETITDVAGSFLSIISRHTIIKYENMYPSLLCLLCFAYYVYFVITLITLISLITQSVVSNIQLWRKNSWVMEVSGSHIYATVHFIDAK